MIVDPANVLERPLGGVRACPGPACEVVGLSLEAPCPCQAELVAKLVEDGYRTVGGVDQLVRRDLRFRKQAQEAALDECVGGQAAVAGRSGSLDRLCQHSVGPAHVAAQALHDSDVGNELDAQGIIRGQQRGGA